MNGMAELITITRYWQEWSDPALVVAVLHNNDLNQVTWEMRAMDGVPKFAASQTLPDISYAGFAASLGLRPSRSEKPTRSARPGIGPSLPTARRCSTSTPIRRPAHPAPRHLGSDARAAKAIWRGRECLGGSQDRHQAEGPGVPARHERRVSR